MHIQIMLVWRGVRKTGIISSLSDIVLRLLSPKNQNTDPRPVKFLQKTFFFTFTNKQVH